MSRRLLLLAAPVLLAGCDACGADAQPAEPRTGPVEVTVDASGEARPISPWVYGINGHEHLEHAPGVFTAVRFGGNRTTTYNWENNASNAGHDWPQNQNDGYLSESDEPGAAVVAVLDAAEREGAAAVITVPMIGRVAADKRADGDVSETPHYLERRFVRSVARCGGSGVTPDLDDDRVCQDTFVRFVRREAARRGVPLLFALDNEPASWPVTHPLLRRHQPVRYAELIETSIEYASMITEEAPDARVIGPVSFGWPAMTRLAGAPDAGDRNFLTTYLSAMRTASGRRDRRLLHALDVHWYPDVPIHDRPLAAPEDDPARARMRMQVPRSLYDPDYEEPSWIVDDWLEEPIRLLPRLREQSRRHFRHTKLAITEWAYGGAEHPSGAVAVADALGAMGRHGVLVATYWPLTDQEHPYALAAFRIYRRPADGVAFGDRSVEARSDDRSRVSAWGSLDGERPRVMLIARTDDEVEVRLRVDGAGGEARRFELSALAARPREIDPVTLADGRATLTLPGRSVTLLAVE
ncbi:MAG TPA: glycoside hydrolase family 44 protein [Sandaracinaceae bacterium LLY-WYZ-13_1]|nr:glycoside hydrolase family 44 protein [Sandaracinaceae bacterium LLY-WYZ-13_1]